jgi:hypothetical protein
MRFASLGRWVFAEPVRVGIRCGWRQRTARLPLGDDRSWNSEPLRHLQLQLPERANNSSACTGVSNVAPVGYAPSGAGRWRSIPRCLRLRHLHLHRGVGPPRSSGTMLSKRGRSVNPGDPAINRGYPSSGRPSTPWPHSRPFPSEDPSRPAGDLLLSYRPLHENRVRTPCFRALASRLALSPVPPPSGARAFREGPHDGLEGSPRRRRRSQADAATRLRCVVRGRALLSLRLQGP